ncbi:MAG: site-specific integrase [Prevotella sp.]|nr:site-specific integrase [Prevotella sp.]
MRALLLCVKATDRVGLSADELITLAETPCAVPVLKRAFLFACLTGLRKSDVKALTWEMIQPEADGTPYVTIRMQKTKQIIHNPIGDEALELIKATDKRAGRVFPGFKDNMTQTALKQWVRAAGITKNITFHSSRHTYCSLQLGAGTDSRTVQTLVGHKNLATTQGYLDNVDRKKVDAANRITLKRSERVRKPERKSYSNAKLY